MISQDLDNLKPISKPRRKRGKPAKRKPKARETARESRARMSSEEIEQLPKRKIDVNLIHKRVISLYLNNMEAPEIAKRTGYAPNTIRGIIQDTKSLVAKVDPEVYVDLYVKTYQGILNSYQATNQELVSQYVGLQQTRDTHQINLETADQAKQADHTKAIVKAEAALVKLTDKINSNNKNFVDMVSRMGVPHSATPNDIESHTDSPIETFYEEVPSGKGLAEDTEASLLRQLEYVRKEKGSED